MRTEQLELILEDVEESMDEEIPDSEEWVRLKHYQGNLIVIIGFRLSKEKKNGKESKI